VFSYQGFERAELLVWEHDKLNPLAFWTFEVYWNVFSYTRMCSLILECVLLLHDKLNPLTFWTFEVYWNVFSYTRMCSLRI